MTVVDSELTNDNNKSKNSEEEGEEYYEDTFGFGKDARKKA